MQLEADPTSDHGSNDRSDTNQSVALKFKVEHELDSLIDCIVSGPDVLIVHFSRTLSTSSKATCRLQGRTIGDKAKADIDELDESHSFLLLREHGHHFLV